MTYNISRANLKRLQPMQIIHKTFDTNIDLFEEILPEVYVTDLINLCRPCLSKAVTISFPNGTYEARLG
jgi:hypothetical protein